MKIIKYQFLSAEVNRGTEEHPDVKPVFVEKSIPYSEHTEDIAKKEAHNGEYEIVEVEDPVIVPTQLDRVEAQGVYTAMMTGTLLDFEGE